MRYSIQSAASGKFQITDNETGRAFGKEHGTLEEATGALRTAEALAMQDRIAVCQRGQCGI